jgi:hypothetical protein
VQPYPINFRTVDFSTGQLDGLVNNGGTLTLASSGLHPYDYTDPYSAVTILGQHVDGSGSYRYGTWTSPIYTLNTFAFDELVSSWNSDTSPGTFIRSEVKPQLNNGHWAKWYTLGLWTYSDADFHRTSVGGQGDADGYVAIDTFFAKDHPAVSYQLRLTIYRRSNLSADRPPVSVTRYSAVASAPDEPERELPEPDGHERADLDLNLPMFSQETHHASTRVRQRRRGLVQPDLDGDGHALLGTAVLPVGAGETPGSGSPIPRSTTRPLRLRLPLPGRRQLAFNTAYAAGARAAHRRHAAAQPA